MAEKEKKPYFGTRLFKDSNETGSPIVDELTGEWVGGKVLIELFDGKTGARINQAEKRVTRLSYPAWREEFNVLTVDEVIEQYFPGEKKEDKTVVKTEATDATAEALKVALAELAALKAEKEAPVVPETPVVEPEDLGDTTVKAVVKKK